MIFTRALLIVICLFCHIICQSQDDSAEVLSDYNSCFQRISGWIGADAAYSVPLTREVVLWLYGDTWIGKVVDGKRVGATLINNSIAIQSGKDPVDAALEFYYRRNEKGHPIAFITPDSGRGWFWIFHGIRTRRGLYLFLLRIDKTATQPPGFRVIGTTLAFIHNPDGDPMQWQIEQWDIPWGRFDATKGVLLFGSALLQANEHIYIYGTDEDIANGVHQKYSIVARVEEGRLSDFSQWRFFDGRHWQRDWRKSKRLFAQAANEYTVCYRRAKYFAVYNESGISANIVLRSATNPWGPWSQPQVVYRCPEVDISPEIFCYAGKAHPALSGDEHLVVSYVANSRNFWQLIDDARLYWPRFCKIPLPK